MFHCLPNLINPKKNAYFPPLVTILGAEAKKENGQTFLHVFLELPFVSWTGVYTIIFYSSQFLLVVKLQFNYILIEHKGMLFWIVGLHTGHRSWISSGSIVDENCVPAI